jgi:hypothetical protein
MIKEKKIMPFWKRLFGTKEPQQGDFLGGEPIQTSVRSDPQSLPATVPSPPRKESAPSERQTEIAELKGTSANARIATGRVGAMPIYEIDPQTWAHGAEVLHYLFVESHCRKLKDSQQSFRQ